LRLLTLTTKSLSQSVSNSASQAVITKLLPVEHMVHYTHSVFSECVVESQSRGGRGGGEASANQLPMRLFLVILPRRVVCASTRSDASI